MKKLPVKNLIGFSIFFLILLFSVIIIHPSYKHTVSILNKNVEYLCKQVENSYGINISYDFLSPSIITGIYLKGICVKDSRENESLLKIKKVVLRYNFFKLISGNVKEALKDLTVDGIILDINLDDENIVLKRLLELKNASGKKNTAKFEIDENKKIDLKKIVSSIPFDVFIKNVHIQFSNKTKIVDVFLRKLNLDIVSDLSRIILKTTGSILYSDGNSKKNLSAFFSLDGTLFEDLEGSLVNLCLSDFTDGNYKFNKLNMRISYDNQIAEIRTIQNVYPFYFFSSYNFETTDVLFTLKTLNLNPSKLFSAKKETNLLKKLKFFSTDINLFADYNFISEKLNYSSEGKIRVYEKSTKDIVETTYSFSGNEEQILIKSVESVGKSLNANLSGTLIFDGFRFSGSANLYNYTLSNGGVLSTELFFDPLDKGFVCFAPQFLLDDKVFSALQLKVIPQKDSVDFNFELSDYAHYDTEKPGLISIDGSFILDTKYVQASMMASSMYLDSVVKAGTFFSKKKTSSEFSFLSPFMFNTELYFSSDLKTFSYNIPYFVVANTKKDNQFVYVSLDGNDTNIQVSQFDIINNGKMTQVSGFIENLPDLNESFLMFDVNFASIPYHFSGKISNSESISISGDYGFAFDMHKSGKKRFDGSVCVESLPVSFLNTLFAFSADTGFSYSEDNGINLVISKLYGQEAGGKYLFSPQFYLSGSASKYGVFFNKINYSDKFSSLDGESQLLWNINNGIFDSANFSVIFKEKNQNEDLIFTAEVSNPNKEAISSDFFKNSMYVNSQIILKNFNLNRVTSEYKNDNKLSATVIATGTLENPYIGLNIDSFNMTNNGKSVNAKGSAYVEDKVFKMEKVNVDYNKLNFSNLSAMFNLNSYSGKISGILDTVVMKKTVHAPWEISVSDTFIEKGKIIPTEFAANLLCNEISGSFFTQSFPLEISVLHSSDITSIYSSKELGLSGIVSNNGDVKFSVEKNKPLSFDLSGSISDNKLDFDLDNVYTNIGELFTYVDIPKFKVYKGILNGSMKISGVKKDPDFLGNFIINGADFSLPSIVPSHITVPKISAVMNHTQLEIPEIKGLVKNNYPIFANATIYFDRWFFERLDAKVYTPKNVFAPADFNIRLAEIKGDASINLDLSFADSYLDVSGSIAVKNATARAKTKEIAANNPSPKRLFFVRSDLDINLLQHCSFRFDPLLRAVFTPNSQFKFKYDMEESLVQIDGEISLRSGDIAYLSRNFYLKNGTMRFNKNETTFNPLITLTAETREKDENGNDVRLILSAVNQYLFDFSPQISSIPAKSETEISQMLGQIVVGDSKNISGFLLSAGDYALQSTVGRNVENKLRDFFNFDILSIRTSVLQNALKLSLSTNSDSEKKALGIGNYLDNSTVYIGKYFGSALYADALLHWTYDESRVDDRTTVGGLIFKPEIGLEMESPFANIRWNMAPDITALMNSKLVASTSVTLSWKFSF